LCIAQPDTTPVALGRGVKLARGLERRYCYERRAPDLPRNTPRTAGHVATEPSEHEYEDRPAPAARQLFASGLAERFASMTDWREP
jgi:hypothetical protein